MSQSIATPGTDLVQSASAKPADIASITEFLAFKLGAEEYGIDILRVQEIRSYENPTNIANAPSYIKGVINLRGVIVPIIDMRLKFNIGDVKYDAFTVVIMLNIDNHIMGIVVDGVSDVIAFTLAQLLPAPQLSATVSTDHIMAIGSIEERMLILLDIAKLLGSAEMGLIAEQLS